MYAVFEENLFSSVVPFEPRWLHIGLSAAWGRHGHGYQYATNPSHPHKAPIAQLEKHQRPQMFVGDIVSCQQGHAGRTPEDCKEYEGLGLSPWCEGGTWTEMQGSQFATPAVPSHRYPIGIQLPLSRRSGQLVHSFQPLQYLGKKLHLQN